MTQPQVDTKPRLLHTPALYPVHGPVDNAPAAAAADQASSQPCSQGFLAMIRAFHATGGTARGDELGRLLEQHQQGDYISLAKLMVAGHLFVFEWRHTLWTPMFQFDLDKLSLKTGPQRVRAELDTAMTGWEVAQWFATPNPTLQDRTPVDLIDTQIVAVMAAARLAHARPRR